MQPGQRPEQLDAAFDLEQQGIGRFEAHQRGELLRQQAAALQ
jgi:hypothetical protein